MSNVVSIFAPSCPLETLHAILDQLPEPDPTFHATKRERAERYARLIEEGKIRGRRAEFYVV